MPATQITVNPVVGPYPSLPVGAGSLNLTFTNADVANGNFYAADPTVTKSGGIVGGDIILVWNTDTNPHQITFQSQPDSNSRSGDITNYVVVAGVIAAFRISDLNGWGDNQNQVFLTGDSNLLMIAVLRR